MEIIWLASSSLTDLTNCEEHASKNIWHNIIATLYMKQAVATLNMSSTVNQY